MKRLFNNILNEVLKVYDFDSWDNTEQTFKDDISNRLNIFIFSSKAIHYPEHNKLCIFDQGNYYYDCGPDGSWPFLDYYDQNGVYIDGVLYKLKEGRTLEEVPKKEFEVVIPGLELITNYKGMFRDSDIVSTGDFPNSGNVTDMSNMFCDCAVLTSVKPFDTSKCITMVEMFIDCDQLKSVPKFNCANVLSCYKLDRMFYNCYSLKDIPLFENIEKVQTPRYNPDWGYAIDIFKCYNNNQSESNRTKVIVLPKLSAETLNAWKIDIEGNPWILKKHCEEALEDTGENAPYFTPQVKR